MKSEIMATPPKPLTLTPTLLRRLLLALGPTAGSVARKLRRQKIKGIRGKSAACPLAIYLKYKLVLAGIDHPAVLVHGGYVQAHAPRNFGVILPYGCRRFVKRYDAGKYRALERA